MTTTDTQPSEFTPNERAYIRNELDRFFSTFPTIADGIQLRTWRTGARKDQPKLTPPAQSLLARDLVRLDTSGRLPRVFFTAAGLRRCAGCSPTGDWPIHRSSLISGRPSQTWGRSCCHAK
jgi:hypothetical protein